MIDLIFRTLGVGFVLALLFEIPQQVRRVRRTMVRTEFADAAAPPDRVGLPEAEGGRRIALSELSRERQTER